MPWTVWMLYTFLSRSNLIKWLFWKINNNRVDSGSIWKLFDFNHLSLLLSEWHHHDFPLSFLQVQHPLKVSLDYLSIWTISLRVSIQLPLPTHSKSSTLCLLVTPANPQLWFGATAYFLSVLSAESCSRKIT